LKLQIYGFIWAKASFISTICSSTIQTQLQPSITPPFKTLNKYYFSIL
jgi:hypothetical protein